MPRCNERLKKSPPHDIWIGVGIKLNAWTQIYEDDGGFVRKYFTLLIACRFFMAIGSLASVQGSQHGKVTWGTPDQPWGTRRPATAADQKLRKATKNRKPLPLECLVPHR